MVSAHCGISVAPLRIHYGPGDQACQAPLEEREEQPARRKLLDRVHDAIRLGHYSIRAEQALIHWIERCALSQELPHSADMTDEGDQELCCPPP